LKKNTQNDKILPAFLLLAGTGLCVCMCTFSFISGAFAYDTEDLEKPILEAIAIMITAAGMYLFFIFRHKDLPISFRGHILILFLGLIMRLSLIGSTPVLEDDYSRYLWDGGSRDGTLGKAAGYDVNIIEGPKGRGLQIAEGTKRAKGGAIVILHAECSLDRGAVSRIISALNANRFAAGGARWA